MGKTAYNKRKCEHSHHLHYGTGLPVFRGDAHQQGYGLGSIISGLFRSALPVIAPMLKSGAKSLAKTALKTGRNVLSDVVTDRYSFKDSIKRHIGDALSSPVPREQVPRKKRRLQKRPRKQRDIFS